MFCGRHCLWPGRHWCDRRGLWPSWYRPLCITLNKNCSDLHWLVFNNCMRYSCVWHLAKRSYHPNISLHIALVACVSVHNLQSCADYIRLHLQCIFMVSVPVVSCGLLLPVSFCWSQGHDGAMHSDCVVLVRAVSVSCTSDRGSAPRYLQEVIQPAAEVTSRRRLLSSSSSALLVPVTRRTTLGDWAFAVAGPHAWNTLPDFITDCSSSRTFKQCLKTYLFSLSFWVHNNTLFYDCVKRPSSSLCRLRRNWAELVVVGVWNADCEKCKNIDTLSERGLLTLGPARRVAENPFLIIVGWYSCLLSVMGKFRSQLDLNWNLDTFGDFIWLSKIGFETVWFSCDWIKKIVIWFVLSRNCRLFAISSISKTKGAICTL